jgi:diguanylate cyclase (GGDEF)-like protein
MSVATSVERLHQRLDEHLNAVTFDIEEALVVSAQVEADAERLGDDLLRMRARLLRADALDRRGEVGPGAKLAWEVNRWAADHGHNQVLAHSHRLLSSAYENLGDAASCLDHALCAVELLDADATTWQRARHTNTLADALSAMGSYDEARRRYAAAEEMFVLIGDVERQMVVLNNLAYTEHRAGNGRRAWEVAQRMLAMAETDDIWLHPSYVETCARANLDTGRYAEAVAMLRACLAEWKPNLAEADALAEVLLTLCEAQRLAGDTDRVQETLDQCRRLCEERGLADVRVRLLQEQAAFHAAQGDYRRAYETHCQFHAEAEELHSHEREARAQIRQAMFETSEARQDAERFWEQARRDALTGLHNRRFVDERLPVLIVKATQSGTPLAIALVDLDHFKRINDMLSHEAGDRVLVRIAALLDQAAEAGDPVSGAFAARLGGEEFVLVLPGTTAEAAVARLEELRLAVRGYDWSPVTGDLPVSISAGIAAAGPTSTQASLLDRADQGLYDAKRRGRDLVVAGPPVTPTGSAR